MLEFLRRILWDQSAFERYSRAFIGAFSIVLLNGKWPETDREWLAAVGVFLAYLVGAGEKNAVGAGEKTRT